MKNRNKIICLVFLFLFSLFMTACSDESKQVKSFAKTYAENLMKGDWETVAKQSTGEQLSNFLLLSDQLSQSNFVANVRLVEVVDSNVEKNLAKVTVHVVRTLEVEGYGRITDDRQLLLSLYKIDGEWKVYKTEVLVEN